MSKITIKIWRHIWSPQNVAKQRNYVNFGLDMFVRFFNEYKQFSSPADHIHRRRKHAVQYNQTHENECNIQLALKIIAYGPSFCKGAEPLSP